MPGRPIKKQNSVIDRLKTALSIKTDSDLAKLLNVARTTVSELRRSGSYTKKMLDIALQRDININWLLTGEGKPFVRESEVSVEQNDEFLPVPYLDAIAGAGTTAGFQTDEIREVVYMPSTLLKHLTYRPKDIYLIRASGDSMSPTITSEDILIVQRCYSNDELQSGSIYILRRGYELLVKRIDFYKDKIILRSDNDKIKDDVITKSEFDEITIVAQVIGVIRPL